MTFGTAILLHVIMVKKVVIALNCGFNSKNTLSALFIYTISSI